MATVDKTWVFGADNEGLADVGDSAWAVNHDTAGNPGGSIEFGATGLAAGTTSERARRASTGESWETWGVPAGATVTDAQIISLDSRDWNGGVNCTSITVKARIVDSAGATVHAAGDLYNATINKTSVWSANGAGTSRAVDAAKQASTTDVRLEVELSIVLTGVATADVGIDNILLRITYTTGAGAVRRKDVVVSREAHRRSTRW